MANSLNLYDKIFWLGPIHDLPAFYSACTITTSSSSGEGFPNVVAESLACETPCVATDVGDSARVLGPGGVVIPSKDQKAMASAWEKLLNMPKNERAAMGQKGRKHIEKNFSMDKMVKETEEAFSNLAGRQ
jgi:glycosyltransferase involved in cell wall biosynthesis